MFLYNCISFAINNISNITNKFLDILYNCNYFINKSQVIKCLDEKYMYDNYCDISIETCNCIENGIYNNSIYNDTIYNIKYLYLIFYLSSVFVIIYFCCNKPKIISTSTSNSNSISLLDEDDNTSNILYNDPMLNNNYYVIDKNDTLPKYNEIENEIYAPKITIIEIYPPNYNEINNEINNQCE